MQAETTPKKKLNIDVSAFGEDKQAALAKMYEDSLKNIKEGGLVKGKILEIRPGAVVIDIDYKSEGFVPAEEFSDLATLKAGDEVEVMIEQLEDEDGRIILSKQRRP